MRDCITFTHDEPGGLRRTVWTFWFYQGNLVLDSYAVHVRSSKRKRTWEIERIYSRLSLCRMPGTVAVAEENVPLTDEIKQEALELFKAPIKVVRWSEVSR